MASRVREDRIWTFWFRHRSSQPGYKEALLTAIKSGTLEDVKKILGPDSQPNLFYQETLDIAIETACNCRKKSIVEILLRSGARIQQCLYSFIDNVTKEGKIVTTEEMGIIKLLLENSHDDHKRAVVIKTVSKNRSDLIDLLLTSKVGLNSESLLSSVLFEALRYGRIECIEILMRHGGKINAERAIEATLLGNTLGTLKRFPQLYKQTFQNVECISRILFQVVSLGNIEFLKFMLESKTNLINLITDKDQLLISTKNAETLQLLLDQGVVVHDSVEMCCHVLELIRQGKLDMAKIFFDSGLNVDSKNFRVGHEGTPLTEASNEETVRYLIDKGAQVNKRVSKTSGSNRTTTALLEALSKKEEVLKVLLEMNANPEVIDYKGFSALMIASQIPNGEGKVKMLLEAGACVNRQTKLGKTALLLAAGCDETTSSVKLLLSHGADVNLQSSHLNALLIAMTKKHFEMTLMLAQSGVNVRILNMSNGEGDTPVMMAVKLFPDNESSKLIDVFATADADLNKPDGKGYTALMRAVQCNKHLTLKTLMDSGADINAKRSGETALSLAAMSDSNFESIKILLKYGADVNHKTILFNALARRIIRAVQILAESGCNTQTLNMTYDNGDSPLTLVIASCNYNDNQSSECINILVTAGAIVDKRNSKGYTPLMKAAQYKKYLALKSLIESGANVNASLGRSKSMVSAISLLLNMNYYDCTALRCVEELLNGGSKTSTVSLSAVADLIRMNVSSLVPKIIQNGCAPDAKYYKSLLCVALENGRDNIARYLLGNWFLTKSDILLKFSSDFCHPKCEELLTELTSQPFSLLTLSFVEVSSALGSGSERETRVRKSGLPPMLQTKLLFKTEEVQLIADEEERSSVLNYVRSHGFISSHHHRHPFFLT